MNIKKLFLDWILTIIWVILRLEPVLDPLFLYYKFMYLFATKETFYYSEGMLYERCCTCNVGTY